MSATNNVISRYANRCAWLIRKYSFMEAKKNGREKVNTGNVSTKLRAVTEDIEVRT